MKRKFCTLIAFSLISVFVFSQSAMGDNQKNSFSLKEIQAYAVKYSHQTRNAHIDISKARGKIRETTAFGLPQLNAQISYQDMAQLATTLIPARIFDPDADADSFLEMKFGTQHNATLDVTASQLLFQGSYLIGLRAAKTFLKFSQQGLIKSEIEIKELVTNTYYLILLSEHTKETLESTLTNSRKTLYEVTEMNRAGFSEETDVDQIQLSVTELEDSIKSIDYQIFVSYLMLKYQMGFALEREIELSDNLDMILKKIDSENLLSENLVLENHIDYRLALTNEQAMTLTLNKERSEGLPSLSAFVSHTQNAMRDKLNFFASEGKWFPSTIIGLNINIPIFSSGMRAARISQAKYDLQKARNDRAYLGDGLLLTLLQARSDFATALEKSKSTEKNVALAQKIYDNTLAKYREGTASSLELTQTRNQYLMAESNYVKAVVDLLTAKTKLDKALNRL